MVVFSKKIVVGLRCLQASLPNVSLIGELLHHRLV